MSLKGIVVYRDKVFNYSYERNKVVVCTQEPTRMGTIRKVEQLIHEEIEGRMEIRNEVLFDFKTSSKSK
ncbi:MAG: hypothetical protein AB7O47_02015 [Flavobacteriales bacterium]